ncbi:MAG: polyphosphate kinase 1 [Lachnospiraceae bacterium]|nr:polyphosphate kinase 1 [Lachnospiraceae bacterium]
MAKKQDAEDRKNPAQDPQIAIEKENNGLPKLPPLDPAALSTQVISEKKAKKARMDCFENRELSWLRFNERVLEEAEDLSNPLCERLNFLSIYQTNLDEFFMVRVGSLHDQMLLNNNLRENKTFMSPGEQIEAVCKRTRKLSPRYSEAYRVLVSGLKEYGVRITDFDSLEKIEAVYLETYFRNEVLPLLSPVIVSKDQPFPFLENGHLYAFAVLKRKGEKDRVGLVSCSVRSVNRLIQIPGHRREYLLLEDLVLHFISLVFRRYEIAESAVIRITRNADIDADSMYDEDLDYRELMEQMIKSRRRLSPIRLEYSRALSKKSVIRLSEYLNLDERQIIPVMAPLDLSFFSAIRNDLSQEAELFYEKRSPQRSPMVAEDRPIMDQAAEKDFLFYYPYERMNPVIRMLLEAGKDPDVVSIRMTLYRLAKNSQVIAALAAAAEAGKRVDVLVELKARFDEENNIHWTHTLEDAGCHVLYGLGRYKVHSKLLLITRKKDGNTQYITQIGTGNYNENTARLYTDFCFITSKEKIGLQADKVFDALFTQVIPDNITELLCAPRCLQNRVIEMIDEEISYAKEGKTAYIGLKLNSVTDRDIMLKLVEASQAGVKIEMVVRGINCLRAGIPGLTENIRVVSIVGRLLEHARIYIFGVGDREKVYISSADFMTRNTLKRVEVGAPIEDPALRKKIHHIFDLQLRDNVKGREQRPSGSYKKIYHTVGEEEINSQEIFYREAYEGILN